MKTNDKIYVSEYLKDLNQRVDHACIYGNLKKDHVNKLTCKDLAIKCEVTQATISNLTTSSKFCLLYKLAEEILNSYYEFFIYDEAKAKEENPKEIIYPRDKNYIIMNLTSYYTDEWFNN